MIELTQIRQVELTLVQQIKFQQIEPNLELKIARLAGLIEI